MWVFKQNSGFSIVEVLVSMLILSAAMVVYTKSTSSTVAATIDNTEKQQIAILATDLNNVFAAHVASLGPDATKEQVLGRVNQLANEFKQRIKKDAQMRGYLCNGNTPVALNQTPNPSSTGSTLFDSWTGGPAICIDIQVNNAINTGFNGVWIETEINWLGLTQNQNQIETVRVPSLIAPM